jgi:hypothetical protein
MVRLEVLTLRGRLTGTTGISINPFLSAAYQDFWVFLRKKIGLD